VLQNQTAFEGTLTVPLSDYLLRVPHAAAAAKRAARAAGETAAATGRDVEIDGRNLYYDWVRARLQVTVSEQAVEQARGHLEDAKKAFAVGTSSKADVLQAESSLAQAELLLQRTLHLTELQEGRLRIAMHDTSGAPYAIGEDVLADQPAAAQNAQALAAQALDRREELRALAFNADSLRARADLERAGMYPRLDLVAGAQYANPNPRAFPQEDKFSSSWDVTVQLSWTPSDIPASRAAARENERRAEALVAQRNQAADGVRVEVLAAVQAVKDAQSSIETSAKNIVTAEEAYRVRRALYQNGRATSLELSDTELELTRARLENVNARVDLRVALARLERATAAR
jgi:outer membrane protein TolC